MAYLKEYAWERKTFPAQYAQPVEAGLRCGTTRALARRFGLGQIQVTCSTREDDKGLAFGGGCIRLPLARYGCSLGVVLHELAHLLDHRAGGKGHAGSFRKWVIKTQVEGLAMFLEATEEARKELESCADREVALMVRLTRQAERKARSKAYRQTRGYKMERLRARIKRLESRIRRNQTLLKSARRSLAAYERTNALRGIGVGDQSLVGQGEKK